MNSEVLPQSLVWEGAHVSDVGLTAMADGQESILGAGVVEHVESCERCAGRLGQIALVSSAVGEALLAARPVAAAPAEGRSPSRPPVAAPRPYWALATAVAAAAVAALPTAHGVMRAPAFAASDATHAMKALMRGGVALARSHALHRGLPVATLAASALLVLMGWVVARWVSHGTTMTSEGSRS